MKTPKFSIIIPAFNVENYINECIISIVEQEYKNFEIILINDGSSDSTLEICEKWVELDKRIHLINIEHAGQGTARNVGIQQSKGEYLVFVDSDDYLLKNALSIIEKYVEQHDADIFVYDVSYQMGDERYILKQELGYSQQDYIINSTSLLWDKIFKASFLKNNFIELSNLYGEDIALTKMLVAKSKKFIKISENVYMHNIHENNLTTNSERLVELPDSLQNMIDNFKKMLLFDKYCNCLEIICLKEAFLYLYVEKNKFNAQQYMIIKNKFKGLFLTNFKKGEVFLQILESEFILIGNEIIYNLDKFNLQGKKYYNLQDYNGNIEKTLSTRKKIYIISFEHEFEQNKFHTYTEEMARERWEIDCLYFLQNVERQLDDVAVYLIKDNKLEITNQYIEDYEEYFINKSPVTVYLKNIVSSNQLLLAIIDDLRKKNTFPQHKTGLLMENCSERYSNYTKKENFRLHMNENILKTWLEIYLSGRKLEEFFVENGYKKIAIYGMGYLGRTLYNDLKDSSVSVLYGIDLNWQRIKINGLKVISIQNLTKDVDVIVNTVTRDFIGVNHYDLARKSYANIVTLIEIMEFFIEK